MTKQEHQSSQSWVSLITGLLWFRGAAFALALLGIVTQVFDLSQSETLRAFHAIILSWNVIPSGLMKIMSIMPFIPELDEEARVIFGNVLIVLGFEILRSSADDKFVEKKPKESKVKAILTLRSWSDLISQPFIWLSAIWFGCLLILTVFEVNIGHMIDILVFTGGWWVLFLNFFSIVFCISLAALLIKYSIGIYAIGIAFPQFTYGFGFVFFVILTIEFLYLARLPIVSEFINSNSCEILNIPMAECSR